MSAREQGFTVIEALCAFAILSVTLIALYAASGTALRGLRSTEDREAVALLARSKLDELKAERGPLARGQGRFTGSDVEWRLDVRDVGERNLAARLVLQELTLTLAWPGRNGEETLLLTTRHLASVPP